MRFWDSSAVVPLLVAEAQTTVLRASLRADTVVAVWWATEVECVSALARRERDGALSGDGLGRALAGLAEFAQTWQEVQAGAALRRSAVRLVRTHPLRAADALQLAAALSASEGEPGSLPFVTLDGRLRDAATREGFPVEPSERE